MAVVSSEALAVEAGIPSPFEALERLYGRGAAARLRAAHCVVIGLGGVGSWAAEALARSGVGRLTLMDLDDVCSSNINRQVHALQDTVGLPKVAVMAQRCSAINPQLELTLLHDFLTAKNLAKYISPDHSVVVDATDATATKAALAAYCSARKIRLVTVGASGGKRDPTQIRVADLARTECDPLLAKVRGELYRRHGFARDRNRKFRIDAVYSTEQMVYPQPGGAVCSQKTALEGGVRLDCSGGFGSIAMVTGGFGFAAASRAVERVLGLPAK